jgi:hypothetical protein
LIRTDDVAVLGGLAGRPGPKPEVMAESCAFPLNSGSDDLAIVGLFKPYDEVRAQQQNGHEETADGYRTWVKCGESAGYETCTASAAVRDDRTFVVGLTRRGETERQVIGELQKLTEMVLARLPAA